MTTSRQKNPKHGQLWIVRKYEADDSNDLAERLKVVFEPWLDVIPQNHDQKGDTNEKQSRSDHPSVDNPATRRHKPREAD